MDNIYCEGSIDDAVNEGATGSYKAASPSSSGKEETEEGAATGTGGGGKRGMDDLFWSKEMISSSPPPATDSVSSLLPLLTVAAATATAVVDATIEGGPLGGTGERAGRGGGEEEVTGAEEDEGLVRKSSGISSTTLRINQMHYSRHATHHDIRGDWTYWAGQTSFFFSLPLEGVTVPVTWGDTGGVGNPPTI